VVQDKLRPIAELVALALILFGLHLRFLTVFLQRVDGNQIFEDQWHQIAQRAPQILIEKLD
jgi:hypothetical protein